MHGVPGIKEAAILFSPPVVLHFPVTDSSPRGVALEVMKFLLLVLALVGSACALQYPVEYHYKYEGRLATGIPSIRPQVVSLGIRTLAIIQMKTKMQGIVKLTDVQSGEYSGDLECAQLRQPIPLKWSPMPQYKEQLEEPFAVSFQEEEGEVMKVPQSDVEFVTNIRKSVVEALRLEPVVANLGGMKGDRLAGIVSGGKAPDAFSLEEETLFGRCESQYTLTRLPNYQVEETKKDIEKHLKEDEQAEGSPRSSEASVPKLKEEYWRLVRAVNFDKCHDRVILQHAGVANMSRAGHAQFKSVQSRSSVGTFILKGEPRAFRVERAIVEGDVVANPFGFKTHRIQTITNQTMVLESAQAIHTPIRLPNTRDVRTWRYEVSSPFSQPEGHPKLWVNYQKKGDKYYPVNFQSALLGLPLTPSMIQEYKKNFLELLDETVREIYAEPSMPSPSAPSWQSTKHSVATTYLHYMTRMMRTLPRSEVEQIFSEIFGMRDVIGQRKQMLLSDIAAASGAAAPIHAVLERIKKGEISHNRTGSIFMTIPNNLYAPSIIPELVEYAKSVDIERNPVLASSVLVNVASLIERVCLDHRKFNYSVPNPIFGNEACRPSEIMNSFLPYLKQKAQEASKSWERAIVIQAISNLGSPEVLSVLKPYIYGQQDPNPRVRTIAIYGLTKRHMPESMREEIFDILMEIADNLREEPEIRQTALTALLTWHPDAAWWQRMARLTWREPNQSMAAYITSTVESLAKSTEPHLHRQARIAAFVLPLLKPFSPSMMRSYNFFYSRFDEPSKVGVNADLAYIQALRDAVPSEIFSSLQGNFGDLHLQIFEVALASSGLSKNMSDLINYFYSSESGNGIYTPSTSRSAHSRYVEDIVSKMKEYVGTKESNHEPMQADIYLRAFDNMHQYIPVNKDVITQLAGEGGSEFIEKLLNGHTMNFTKFFNPIDLEYFVPTEIGLPVMGIVSMPTMNLGDVEARLFTSEMAKPTINELIKAKNVTLLFKSNYKYMSKMIVKMQVPAPWDKKLVETGIDNIKEFNLPVYGNLTLNHTSEIKNLTLNLVPFIREKFPIAYGHNIPYTEVRDFIPSRNMKADYSVIAAEKDRTPVVKLQKQFPKKYTGLDLEMGYQADVPYPFTSGYFADYAERPEYFIRLLASPTAKQWQYSVNLNHKESTRNISISLSFITPSRKSGGSGRMPAFSSEDTIGQKLEKLRSLSEGSQVYGLNAEIFFNGTEFRKYEALLAFTRNSQNQQKKEYRTILAFMANRVPGYTQSAKALCTKAEFTTPDITDLQTLRQIVQSHPQETVHGQVYYGGNCASSEIASYQGSVEVSPERLGRIRDEIAKICNYDEANPAVELQTPAVYDNGNFEIHFSKEKMSETLLNTSYSAQQWIEGAVYPHGYYDNMHRGQQNKISVTMKRPLSNLGYTFWANLPQKYTILSDIHVPYMLSSIIPMTGLKTSFNKYSNLVIGLELPQTCQIQSRQVVTYDALRYNYNPIPCWTTAAVDSRNSDDFIVHTRRIPSGEFEAQILIPKDHISVVLSRTHAIVNGKPIPPQTRVYIVKNQEGKVVMEIRKFTDFYQAQVIGRMVVKVTSEIQVQPERSMKGYLRGLCGDFDGESTFDLSGPKGCLYSDMELFKYAWTIPEGSQCNKQQVEAEHKKVEEFQKDCQKRPNHGPRDFELRSIYESKATNCYQHVYPIKRKGPAICVSMEPVQMCTPQCDLHDKRETMELAKCWLQHNAPSEVRDAEPKGYLIHPVAAPAKFRDQIKVVVATDCRQK